MIGAYRAQCEPGSKTILIIDSGWKGRVQYALQKGLPEFQFHGFYFSFDPNGETESLLQAETFVEWDPSAIAPGGVEALAGFRGASCDGYICREDGSFSPTFKPLNGDVCPDGYCTALVIYLSGLLGKLSRRGVLLHEAMRVRAMRSMLAYPDREVARAFEGWGFAHELNSGRPGALIDGDGSDTITLALGRYQHGNIWPQLAMWSLSGNRLIVKIMQKFMACRRKLFSKYSSL